MLFCLPLFQVTVSSDRCISLRVHECLMSYKLGYASHVCGRETVQSIQVVSKWATTHECVAYPSQPLPELLGILQEAV